jgi:predicted amidohydrolase YtcJ
MDRLIRAGTIHSMTGETYRSVGLRGAALNHEQGRLGSITPGKLADLIAYPIDPLTADPDDLAELTPTFTIVGGRAVHDPGDVLGS